MALRSNNKPKKIILTTDQDLIKDGVQAIDDDFLEWFVKNPSCEEVEIQYRYNFYVGQDLTHYKIIIPQQEPKQEYLLFNKEKANAITSMGQKIIRELYNVISQEESKQYSIGGYAPGNYACNCVTCKQQFIGDKRAVQCEPCATKMVNTKIIKNNGGCQIEEPKQEWKPKEGENVWIKVFSNWSNGIYIGYDTIKKVHLVREKDSAGGYLLSSSKVLPYKDIPNEPKQETLEEASWKYNPVKKLDNEFIRAAFIAGAKWQQEQDKKNEKAADY
jgi:hypothetical protein